MMIITKENKQKKENNFFNQEEDINFYKRKIIERRKRKDSVFLVGDILKISYISKFITYGFEGICICFRKKRLKNLNASVILRNFLSGVGVELTISYFYNRAYRFTVSDYSRKDFYYRKSKLYYLRSKLNKASRIK
jgi:ribosomal protein L19